MFKRTTSINKILALKKRIKIIQGGTSAGKTFGILPILIDKAARNPNVEISVVAESIPHLRRGALKDFIKIMKWTNRYIDSQFNKSLLTYQFRNGSVIEFFSADDASKLRGARRDILYINECNNVTFDAYLELSIRTKKEIYLDFNPANEFWVHTELKDEPDADFIILTYKDNEALDESIVRQIEKNREKAATSSYWANWWRVYGLGEVGSLEGVVFDNWKEIDKIPDELQSWIDNMFEESEPSYDWKSYFRRFCGTSSKTYTKKTRRKLNKRFQENPALKIKTKKKILVGVDTSGSVNDEDLVEFFNEINHMYKTGVSITIAEGDAKIHNVYEYKGDMPDKVTGRGGTDMNPFITYFNEHREFNSLIILTDGHIGENTVKTLKPMMMVICSRYRFKIL